MSELRLQEVKNTTYQESANAVIEQMNIYLLKLSGHEERGIFVRNTRRMHFSNSRHDWNSHH